MTHAFLNRTTQERVISMSEETALPPMETVIVSNIFT